MIGHTSIADPEPSEDGSRSEPHLPASALTAWALLLVCLGFFVLQYTIIPRDSPPGWDEAIYLSQVTRGVEAVFFDPWRARGITLLIAPAVSAGASIEALRMYLMVLSTVGVGLSLSVWLPLIRWAAPVAAFLFSFTWVALLGASQVMPNFWSGLLCLTAAGLTVRWSEGGSTRHVVFAAAALAAAALIRPTDATVLFVVLAGYLTLGKGTSWRAALSLAAGLVVGWLPWVFEMSVRFGGPLQAAREAAKGFSGSPSLLDKLALYLSYTDGSFPRDVVPVPVPGIIWWGALGLLSVLGFLRGITRGERAAALVASLAALAIAIQYLVFVPIASTRFLIPAYAFLAIPASVGLVSLLKGRRVTRGAGVIVLLLVLPWMVWQAHVAWRVASAKREVNGELGDVGREIRRLADGASCSFLTRRGPPQMQLASGCAGERLARGEGPTEEQLERLGGSGARVFVILRRPVRRDSPLRGVRPERFHGSSGVWLIYRFVGTSGTTGDEGAVDR